MLTKVIKFLLVAVALYSGLAVAAVTLSAWKSMDVYEQMAAIFADELEYEEFDPKQVPDAKTSEALEELSADALANISTDEIGGDIDGMETIVSIGEPQLSSVNLYRVEGKVVAIQLYFHQNGGSTKDDQSPEQSHYDTEAEAKAAGIDTTADVCWSANAFYAWDGKEWISLGYETSEGRGFNWCGW